MHSCQVAQRNTDRWPSYRWRDTTATALAPDSAVFANGSYQWPQISHPPRDTRPSACGFADSGSAVFVLSDEARNTGTYFIPLHFPKKPMNDLRGRLNKKTDC